MNTAVANEIDVNAFNLMHTWLRLTTIIKIKLPRFINYLEPMGIYSSKVKKLDEFKTRAQRLQFQTMAQTIPRALLLLRYPGLIKLKADLDDVKGTACLTSLKTRRKIVIKPIQMATPDYHVKDEVDAIILGNTLAMEGGVKTYLKNAVYYMSQSIQTYQK